MTDELRDRIIRMAWEDRTTFDEIEKQTGLTEADVIRVMRKHLRARSFRLWRKRVTGRLTKHAKPFRASRKELRSQSTRSMLEQAD